MSDFIFRVEDFHLTPEQEKRIAGAVRAAVVTELSQLDLSGKSGASSGGGNFTFIPWKWQGGRLLKAIETAQAEKQTLSVSVSGGAAGG
jgi:hypothetical protein